MFSIHSKKIAAALFASFIAVLSIFVVSCQKELSGNGFTITETPPDLTTKITSSVSGFVTDENNAAVNGAAVQVGTSSTNTDKYGYFEVSNVQVVKNAALITVAMPGYFKGIKTYTAAENKSAFFRIKLIPKTNEGNIDAAAGGIVNLTNGLSISLPANAVVISSSNAAYTGQVNVAAHWLSPVAADLDRIMPGDLRGLDSLGFMKLLKTYGMSAVELTGASGELLQIAPGKKATLNFPLPTTLLASAPATIPLWYFDETVGLWKQQGSAVKSGNSYVGEVSHFSYWNCDIPLTSSVQFNCTIVDAAHNPVPNVAVSINNADGSYTGVHGYTDTSGYLSGPVPANAQLVLVVHSDACGNAPYSQNFTTTNVNISLGEIVLPTGNTASVSGNVACNGTAVTNGYVIMKKDFTNYRYPLSSTGTFNFNTTICGSSAVVTFIGEDLTAQQAGNLTTFTLIPGPNAVGTLSGCGNAIDEFINYSINGTNYSLTAPADNLIQEMNTQIVPPVIYISGHAGSAGTVTNTANFSFTQTAIAAGSTQTLTNFISRQINDTTSLTSATNVNITEYGAVGQFIAGNFTTTVTGAPPANILYNITCNFRVRRNL